MPTPAPVSAPVSASAPTRTEARREDTRRAILAAAWALAAEHGLPGLSLRDLAAAVGMRAPSLYSYFPSKAAILDAMFADGYRDLDAALRQRLAELPPGLSDDDRLARGIDRWVAFCQELPARYRVMFTSAVPGWTPSPDAYAASQASYRLMQDELAALGVTDPADLDLFTALTAGLVAQQMANDPDGDRWRRRVDDAVAMFLHHVRTTSAPRSPRPEQERP